MGITLVLEVPNQVTMVALEEDNLLLLTNGCYRLNALETFACFQC